MKKWLALLLAAVMVLSLAACGGGSAAPATTAAPAETTAAAGGDETTAAEETTEAAPTGYVDDGVYRELSIGGATQQGWNGAFDPTAVFSDTYNGAGITLMYDVIFYPDADTGEAKSDILESYEFNKEDPSLTLTLKDCIYFSNGDQMTCEDIVYTLQRVRQHPRTSAYFNYILIDEAEISDDGLTIKIPFSADNPLYPIYMNPYGVLNKSWVEENGGDDFDWSDPELVCGSGPYAVTDYEQNVSTTFELRDDYWNKDARTKGAFYNKITMYVYADESTMMADFENGDLNVAMNLTSQSYNRVQDDELGTAAMIRSNAIATILLNIHDVPALGDINLRKAIILGTDAEAISKVAYGDLYIPAEGFITTNSPFFVEGLKYEFDPEEAKKLVSESSYDGSALNFVLPQEQSKIGEAFQAYMADIGVNVNVEVKDFPTCIQMWQEAGRTAFNTDNISVANPYADAYNQYGNQVSTKNFSAMRRDDPHWNELVQGGQSHSDPAERAPYYEELQKIEYDDYSAIPLCEWAVGYCYDDTVGYINLNSLTTPDLRNIFPAE